VQPVLRLFVALSPGSGAAAELRRAAESLAPGLPPHRLIPADHVHMTLAFIGDTRAKEVREVCESVDRSCAGLGPFILTAGRLVTIPTPDDGGPPRLIAAVTDSPPALLEIQRRLAQRLTRAKKNGRRPRFLPHLTLARYRHGETSDAIDHPLERPVSWRVEACVLFSSTLRAEGSVYAAVHRVALDG